MLDISATLPQLAAHVMTQAPDIAIAAPLPTDLPSSVSPRDRRKGRFAAIACALLAILFATLSYTAVITKSATFDENLHVVGGFMHRFFHDYRINPEDPPLFGLWSALPHGAITLLVDTTSPEYQLVPTDIGRQWIFVFNSLYRTKDTDASAVINTSRFQFVLVGLVLFIVIVGWAKRLRGWTAAIVAGTLLALDPNFLAHTALVKNDVPMALLLIVFAAAVWRMGRHITPLNLLLAGLVCGAAVNVKFSGILLGPMLFIMLSLRALLPRPWRAFGFPLKTIAWRLLVVPIVSLIVLVMVWGATWASYGFRFAAMPDGGTLKTDYWVQTSRYKEVQAEVTRQYLRNHAQPRPPTQQELDAHPVSLVPSTIVWLEDHRWLPQAWLFGFIYTYATTQIRSTFLMGDSRIVGWWYYFPLAMLFKTPMTTIFVSVVAAVGAAIQLISPKLKQWRTSAENVISLDAWTVACIAAPPLIYLLAAMSSNLNLGIRHILPVYPFIFLAVGLFAARLRTMFPSGALIVGGVLALVLAIESFTAWPNYLAFFNAPSGGSRGGIKLLADSNLDWGQDLTTLAKWQTTHRDRPLYLSYFGIADPVYYKIDARSLIGNPPFFPQGSPTEATEPCYMAVSVTNLQGVYLNGDPYAFLRSQTPIDVLGGTIYVYKLN